jgi:hypothetical protein
MDRMPSEDLREAALVARNQLKAIRYSRLSDHALVADRPRPFPLSSNDEDRAGRDSPDSPERWR